MNPSVAELKRDFLGWVALRPRTYAETMEAWRSTCPRMTVWEDSLLEGLVEVGKGETMLEGTVRLTRAGRAVLDRTEHNR